MLLADDVSDEAGGEWACIAVYPMSSIFNILFTIFSNVIILMLLDDNVKDGGGGEWPGVKNRLGGRVPSQLTSATSLHLVL